MVRAGSSLPAEAVELRSAKEGAAVSQDHCVSNGTHGDGSGAGDPGGAPSPAQCSAKSFSAQGSGWWVGLSRPVHCGGDCLCHPQH